MNGITYIFCEWAGEQQKWGIAALPQKDTSESLKEHLAEHVPTAKFHYAEYHNENGFVFTYDTIPNDNIQYEVE